MKVCGSILDGNAWTERWMVSKPTFVFELVPLIPGTSIPSVSVSPGMFNYAR